MLNSILKKASKNSIYEKKHLKELIISTRKINMFILDKDKESCNKEIVSAMHSIKSICKSNKIDFENLYKTAQQNFEKRELTSFDVTSLLNIAYQICLKDNGIGIFAENDFEYHEYLYFLASALLTINYSLYKETSINTNNCLL